MSGHRFWALIEQDSASGEVISIGLCVPRAGGRVELLFPHEAEWLTWLAEARVQAPTLSVAALAYRYLWQPSRPDPAIRRDTGWSATWVDLVEGRAKLPSAFVGRDGT